MVHRHGIPRPNSVWYNDWRQVAVAPLSAFTPVMPVSVIIPCYQNWQPAGTLARTLAALEGQTYPRDLFEVVIADDGAEPPLARPSTPLNVKVVRQERRGPRRARARNLGARAAAHDILLFLDSDMLAEADWMAEHARWHHAVSDVLTSGYYGHVATDGIDAGMIRHRPGSLKEMFTGRILEESCWPEDILARTNHLTTPHDDPFWLTRSGSMGMGKDFYWQIGGFNESFVHWGMEDVELGYRAYIRGGLLVPVLHCVSWHQGTRSGDARADKERSEQLQHWKAAHLIAHPSLRPAHPGRIYTVPQYVVTIDAKQVPTEQVIEAATKILTDRANDLVVRIEMPTGGEDERLPWLREILGRDPRVRVAPAGSALDEFPTAAFHIRLPAGTAFARNLVHRLRSDLDEAVVATATLPDGSLVSITRTWALHRARRVEERSALEHPGAGHSPPARSPADFGEARTLSVARLVPRVTSPRALRYLTQWRHQWRHLSNRVRNIRGPRDVWFFLMWLISKLWRSARDRQRIARDRLRKSLRHRHPAGKNPPRRYPG